MVIINSIHFSVATVVSSRYSVAIFQGYVNGHLIAPPIWEAKWCLFHRLKYDRSSSFFVVTHVFNEFMKNRIMLDSPIYLFPQLYNFWLWPF